MRFISHKKNIGPHRLLYVTFTLPVTEAYSSLMNPPPVPQNLLTIEGIPLHQEKTKERFHLYPSVFFRVRSTLISIKSMIPIHNLFKKGSCSGSNFNGIRIKATLPQDALQRGNASDDKMASPLSPSRSFGMMRMSK